MASGTTAPGPGLLRFGKWRTIRYSVILLAIIAGTLVAWPGLLRNLFTTTGYLAHEYCLRQQRSLLSLHISSDLLIGISYVVISATLAYLVHRARRDIPFSWVFIAFGLFIIACGMTHFMGVVTLFKPLYWLDGEVKLITAIASVATAAVLPFLVPQTLVLIRAAKESHHRKQQLEIANAELEEATLKLRQMDESKTEFFANVSHELRTPLALTLGRTEKLLASPELTPVQRRELEVVHRSARALLKQVNDLLDVSKLSAGRMGLTYSRADIATVTRRTVAQFDSLAADRGLDFTYSGPDSLQAEVDVEKYERILLNLFTNAFKFTPEGGVVRCILEQRDGDVFAVQVRDSGPGIAPDMREAVFERFRQAEMGNTRRFGGTGLGLAIVKEFVTLHGGSVRVDVAPEGGASFVVELPMRAPEQTHVAHGDQHVSQTDPELALEQLRSQTDTSTPPDTTSEEIQAALANAPLVLVAEDNVEMRRFIEEVLAGDYRVMMAADGQEALERAVEQRPDVIISDVMMPRMSGEQLVRELRSRPEFDAVPVILLTARADVDERVTALRQGAQDYIMKPFAAEELRLRVRNLASLARARSTLQRELDTQSQDVQELAHEVTFRKRQLHTALEALRASESRFRRLFDSNIVGIGVANVITGEVIEANDEYLRILGHNREQLLRGEVNWKRLTPAQDIEHEEREVVSQLQSAGFVRPYEKTYVRPDGSEAPVLVAPAMVDETAALAIILDVSERRSAESALRESNERFRMVAEAIPHHVWTAAADGTVDWVNQRWSEYTGMPASQIKQLDWRELVWPADVEQTIAEWQHSLSTGETYTVEHRVRRHDGSFQWFLTRALPLRNARGEVVKWFGTSTNIQDHKEAQSATELLASIVESSDDAIIAKSMDGTVTAWNAGAQRLYGYTAEEAIGRPISMIAPDDDNDIRSIMERIRRGERITHYQTQRLTKDRRLVDVSITVSPLRGPAGQITGASVIARDITESKRAEAALRVSEKLATIGRLAATIAHEINNPLEAVSNVLYLLDTLPTLDRDAKQYVNVAQQELNRIAHIVKQTLGFHRETPEPVALSVANIMGSVLDLHRRKIEAAAIKLETRFEQPDVVHAFPGEMRQVFSNLIGNAIEATGSHGKIVVHVRPWRELIGEERCGVRITVADSGSGISPEVRQHIFEPFYTTKGEKGTGLGLWVSQGIVTKHGGTIRLHSSTAAVRHGTAFTIFLPENGGK